MVKGNPDLPTSTCSRADCDGMTPLDMVTIVFSNNDSYCCPECARSVLKEGRDVPETITLNDPQYAVDRDAFPGVPDRAPSIQTEIEDRTDATEVIDTFERLHPHNFRVVKASATHE